MSDESRGLASDDDVNPEAGDVIPSEGKSPAAPGDTPSDGATPSRPTDAAASTADPAAPSSGADLAREALARARGAAKASGGRPGSSTRGGGHGSGRGRSRGPVPSAEYSGPGPDERDPQPVGASVDRLVEQRRWRNPLSIGTVIAAWPAVVGAEVASHSIPERVDDGVLVVQADSTAWATQLRLLATTITARLAEEVGADGITSVQVLGPAAPSWKKGPRSVPGRGPRDTYG